MFDIGSSELLLIVVVAVVVIGPKDLPRALYKIGQIVGKARGMARHFRTGIDAMVREVELEELEKKWAAQNKRIMEQHPQGDMQAASDAAAGSQAMEGGPAAPSADAASSPMSAPATQAMLPLDGPPTADAQPAAATPSTPEGERA